MSEISAGRIGFAPDGRWGYNRHDEESGETEAQG